MTNAQRKTVLNNTRYINMGTNKRGTKIAYEWISFNSCWTRIKLSEAELLISTGKAKKIEKSMFTA